ncbi:uncharacterized protein [Typha angustifolia]|uniref:uncharacterized protein n=1 Tax=Typha angustifolia TaxID=59011 RepID=UPI003C30DE96
MRSCVPAAVMGGCRDWRDLPCDVLGLVSTKLTVIEYVKFRQLLLAGDDGERFTFLNIPDGITYTLPVPNLRRKYCVGSQFGWLAVLDPLCELSLLNPITGHEIPLPSITTLPNVSANYAPDGSVSSYSYSYFGWHGNSPGNLTPAEFRGNSIIRAVLSSSPSAGRPDFTVIGFLTLASRIICTRPGSGEDKWNYYDEVSFQDVVFHRGSLFGI